jgi:hypothetical protein
LRTKEPPPAGSPQSCEGEYDTVGFGSAPVLAGATLAAEYIGDYIFALAFGIIFQYFAIAPMRGLGLKDGLIAAAKADVISLTAFEVGLFGWMAIMAFVLFPAPPPRAQLGRLLAPHADRHDHRILHFLARKRLADQMRHQGTHVSQRPGYTGTAA